MNYGQIITHDVANGPGLRVSLFVSGCSRHCKGCFNEQTWDPYYGFEFDSKAKKGLLEELEKPYYEGITILGGEPFEPYNKTDVLRLLCRIRDFMPDKDIWIYSGFLYEDLIKDEISSMILERADVLVDGPFILEKRNLMLKFRGSENQRIIDLKRSDASHIELSGYMSDIHK